MFKDLGVLEEELGVEPSDGAAAASAPVEQAPVPRPAGDEVAS